jgi:hypothetical protein
MVITLLPTSSGTLADHFVVPEAVPESPVEVVHVTAATPTLSLAVPLTAMEAADVATIVNPGETMLSDGGVVSPLVGVGVGVGAGVGTAGVGAGVGTTGVGTTGVGAGVGTGVGTTGVGTAGGATAGPYSA